MPLEWEQGRARRELREKQRGVRGRGREVLNRRRATSKLHVDARYPPGRIQAYYTVKEQKRRSERSGEIEGVSHSERSEEFLSNRNNKEREILLRRFRSVQN